MRTILFVASSIVLMSARVDAQGQYQNGNAYANWQYPAAGEGFYSTDLQIQVNASAPAAFYAHEIHFVSDVKGAYMGLIRGENQPNGAPTKIAIFSMWGATSSQGNADCQVIYEGGYVTRCRVPYNWVDYRAYKLRLWRLDTNASGWLWGAWVIDTVTGIETHLGSLRAPPARRGILKSDSFLEYYGPAAPCNSLPYLRAVFYAPTLNAGQIATTMVSNDQNPNAGWAPDCSAAAIYNNVWSADITLGQPRTQTIPPPEFTGIVHICNSPYGVLGLYSAQMFASIYGYLPIDYQQVQRFINPTQYPSFLAAGQPSSAYNRVRIDGNWYSAPRQYQCIGR
jgi:hypothetical protein